MNKKIILAAVATIATVATAQGVYADESTGTLATGNEAVATGDTATQGDGSQVSETTGSSKQKESQGSNATESEREASSEHAETNRNATEITKHDDIIQVTNPEVVIDQSKGTGKYQGFTVEYKNVHFPDDMTINEGDKVTFNLPKEITFQTQYEFDVKNPENAVVGRASTDVATQTVTTVFNDYFANHPLNKQMNLKLDAKWTDKVESGKPVTVNFNGTIVNATIGKEQEIGKDELISKWGSQDKEDPTTINWTIRLNYARKTLNYVKIIDEMSDNQKLVDDYFVMNYVDSIDPWVDKGSAMDLIKSMSKSEHGFEITMNRLDRMVYIWYKTKLTNAVKDSVNPTNKVELKAENDGATSKSSAHLVGGKGDASGENKPEPTFEIPKESPKVEIPEFEGGIPGIPEVREKPEWSGGVVPNEAPMLELPELEIPYELVKSSTDPKRGEPKPQPKTDKPSVPVEINSKPSKMTVESQKEQVNVIYQPTETNAHTLPNTGTESSLVLSFAGMFILSGIAQIALKREDA